MRICWAHPLLCRCCDLPTWCLSRCGAGITSVMCKSSSVRTLAQREGGATLTTMGLSGMSSRTICSKLLPSSPWSHRCAPPVMLHAGHPRWAPAALRLPAEAAVLVESCICSCRGCMLLQLVLNSLLAHCKSCIIATVHGSRYALETVAAPAGQALKTRPAPCLPNSMPAH